MDTASLTAIDVTTGEAVPFGPVVRAVFDGSADADHFEISLAPVPVSARPIPGEDPIGATTGLPAP